MVIKMKRNIKLILLLELLPLLTVILMIGVISDVNLKHYFITLFDVYALMGILLITISGMFIMGIWKDFGKAFSVGSKKYSLLELKSIVEAVSICQKLVLYSGLIVVLVSTIIVLGQLTDVSGFGKSIASAIISGLYVVIIELFLLPIRGNAAHVMNVEIDIDVE